MVVGKNKSLKALYLKGTLIELDLLNKFLQFKPSKRIKAIHALEHPYVSDFHDEYYHTEISCEKHIKIPIDDNIKYIQKEYRQKLYDEILKRKKEIKKKIALQRNKEENMENNKKI